MKNLFRKVFIDALERNAYNSKMLDERRASNLKELHVFRFVQNTKNWSIRIVFQYKFTIKPFLFWLLNSQKYSKISQKVRGLNNVLRCPLAHYLDKTTLCTRNTISSPLFLGFPLSKLLSIP